MFKKNEKIKNLKEFVADPRKKAILFFTFYFFFFLFLIISMRLSPVKKDLPKTSLEKWKIQTEYEFVYTFLGGEDPLVLKGLFKDGESTFEQDGNVYKTENEKFYLEGSDTEYPMDFFVKFVFFDTNAEKISNWIKQGELEYTSTYKDKTLKKSYQIPLAEFMSDNEETEENFFSLAIYERENTLVKIEIDFQKVIKDSSYSKVQIEIMDKK